MTDSRETDIVERLSQLFVADGDLQRAWVREIIGGAIDEITTLRQRVKVLEDGLKPFVERFDLAREQYVRRYSDRAIGYENFDRMPDVWPMEALEFHMGIYRAARRALGTKP